MANGLKKYITFNPVVWLRQTIQMRRFVRCYQSIGIFDANKGHFAVIVMPWLGTTVPWFSIASGLVLASGGAKVTFVLDNLPFGRETWRFRMILLCIRLVLRTLPKQFAILEIEKQSPYDLPTDADLALVGSLTTLNTIWALRGDTKTDGRAAYSELIRGQILVALPAIRAFFAKSKFDCILVPGGIYGSSGVWAWCARYHQVRSVSFDSGGRGLLILSVDGVASHLDDIPRAFSLLKDNVRSEGTFTLAHDAALAEMARRRAGTDQFSSQLQDSIALDSRFDNGVLLALNSPWDTAALGLHQVFDNTAEWIVETVRSVLDNTSAQAIVRQHPGERFAVHRSSDDYAELLRKNFGNNPRVTFIAAADSVNSYDLLEKVSVVVVYTSTIGVEAAAKGKVVITASSSYYSGMGFVWAASKLSAYQDSLADAAEARYSVTPQMRDDALLCYYLTQCCNWVASPLSPESYDDWIQFSVSELVAQPAVKLTFSAVRDNVPVSFMRHLQNVKDGHSHERSDGK
jgi:Capsule polysaccharide biosynthesis protein